MALTLGWAEGQKHLESAVTELGPVLKPLPLSRSLWEQFERLEKQVLLRDPALWQVTGIMVREFHLNVVTDLKANCYLLIPSGLYSLYVQQEPPFGRDVDGAYPHTRYDIAAAARCLALDEWTACVFHLMRAAELALRHLARQLHIKYVDIRDWAEILRDVDGVLKVMENKPKTTQRNRRLKYYGIARTELSGFRVAWRNHVMHSRDTYNEKEAAAIYGHVERLMQHLATRLTE